MKTRINGLPFGLFRFFNAKNAPKYQNFYLATQIEHDQSSYFCRGPDDFCYGPAPMGPTLVTGLNVNSSQYCTVAHADCCLRRSRSEIHESFNFLLVFAKRLEAATRLKNV